MKIWTVREMLAEEPCEEYTEQRIAELWAARERLSLREIANLEIPPEDVVWVACRLGALTPEQMKAWLVDRVVTRAVREHALHCGVPGVERWAVRWLSGKDRTEAAAWAAMCVAWTAEGGGAAAEAVRAAWAASEEARAAVRAEAAARAAARAAASTERAQQLADLLEVLDG